ncbi:MAG: hypothetical protein PHP70_12315 [Gallionella sp.]|nr:hypothetical protein [Gallionella sp.]
MNEVLAKRIRSFLYMPVNNLVEESVETLVANGRDIDAIRLLREKNDISLSDAHDRVARIKGAGKRAPVDGKPLH